MAYSRSTKASVKGARWVGQLAVWVALALPGTSIAREEVNPDQHGVTWARAVSLARASAPGVLVAAARASSAEAEVGVAGMFANPRVTIGTTTGSAVVYGNLFVSLPVFGQREASMDAAAAQARVAAIGEDVARLDAQLAVSIAWTDVWLLEREARIAEENTRRRERLLETARTRFSEGAAPRLDVLRADTEARRARSEVAALKEQAKAGGARLALLLLTTGEETPDHTSGDPRDAGTVPALEALEPGLEGHPVLQRARTLLRAADMGVARDRRARWPLLGVQVGGSFLERYPPPANDVSVAVTMEVPIFNQVLIARAERGRDAAYVELTAIYRQLRGQLASARSELAAAEVRRRLQVVDVLPIAEEGADLAEEAYRSGAIDLTAALAAELSRTDAKLAAVRSTAEASRALAVLAHAAGRAL